MKENQNGVLYHSNSFEREADPKDFTNKEQYQLNGHRRDLDPLEFEAKTGDLAWNGKFVDDFLKNNENEITDTPDNKDPNGMQIDHERDADLSNSDTEDSCNLGTSPELECTVFVEQFSHGHDNDLTDSDLHCNAASNLFESGKNLFTKKIISECQLPELVVCYKDINYNTVKDICVDEGMPTEDKVSIGTINDDFKTAKGGNMKLSIRNGLTCLSLENTKYGVGNDNGSKEGRDYKSSLFVGPKSSSKISLGKDNVQECDLEHSMDTCEPEDDASAKVDKDVPENESFIDSKLPLQKFGTRSYLRSFLKSFDSDANEDPPPDQIPSGDAISASLTGITTNTEPNKNVQPGTLSYNSKVDSGSITFNFKSPKTNATGHTDGCLKDIDAQSIVSEDSCQSEYLKSESLSDTSSHQCISNKLENIENGDEKSIDQKDKSSNACSREDQLQLFSSAGKNGHGQPPEIENISKDEIGNCSSFSLPNQVRSDEGESSFSVASHITFSGPIAYSGSLSLRSDTSGASSRSFAFPVLQSEWNTSPVRMAKADRRHFRRRGILRSGLLCCKF